MEKGDKNIIEYMEIILTIRMFDFLNKEVEISLRNGSIFVSRTENLRAILRELKKKYNFDFSYENRLTDVIFIFILPNKKVNNFKKDFKKMLKLLEKKIIHNNVVFQEAIKVKIPLLKQKGR